jgi:transposase-like protein
MCFLSRYVHRICLCNVFHNFFATSFFLFVAFRDAVTGSFPGVTYLMCYFHIMKNCKEKLHSYAKDVQQDILHNVQQLHSSVSAQECNALMTRLIPKWTEVVPNFLTYFFTSMDG